MHACKEAKRLDLELSLNIQSGWNLGGPKVSEEEATQHLVWSKTTGSRARRRRTGHCRIPRHRDVLPRRGGDRGVHRALPDGTPVTRPIARSRISRSRAATRELGMSAPDCRFLLETSPALPGEVAVQSADILNLTRKMADDGTLRWEVPAGRVGGPAHRPQPPPARTSPPRAPAGAGACSTT